MNRKTHKALAYTRMTMTSVSTVLALACGNPEEPVGKDVLAGLSATAARDSSGGALPPGAVSTAPGSISGTVRGPGGTGSDTLATSTRLSGVKVAAFKVLGGTAVAPDLSAQVVATTTDTFGKFTLPEVPAADYVVTFTPPEGSAYTGVWVTSRIDAVRALLPWWVTLPKK